MSAIKDYLEFPAKGQCIIWTHTPSDYDGETEVTIADCGGWSAGNVSFKSACKCGREHDDECTGGTRSTIIGVRLIPKSQRVHFAFLSRHIPTPEQYALAIEKNIELVHVGDADGFTVTYNDIRERFTQVFGIDGNLEIPKIRGVIVVHAAAALRLIPHCTVGIFENEQRPVEGGKPTFFPKALHLFDRV